MAASYDFSAVFRHTAPSACQFSPGSAFFACAVDDRIIIRSTQTMELAGTFLCSPVDNSETSESTPVIIKTLAFSPHSDYILAGAPKTGTVWVFGLGDGTGSPRAVVRAGIEGMIRCEWSGNGEEILIFSEHGLRVTIYSLVTSRTSVIQNFKPCPLGYAYRSDRRYFAICERHKGKDHIGIYDAADQYNQIRCFPIKTHDVQCISWSPCSRWIAVYDQSLEYSLHIYSPLGPLLGSFSPASPSFVGSDPGHGIRTISWGPRGKWLAVGGWDGKVRIIEADGWRCMCTIDPSVRSASKGTVLWHEPSGWYSPTAGASIVQFERHIGSTAWQTVRVESTKPNPEIGVAQVEWNIEGTCLAIRLDNMPNIIHIYAFLPEASAAIPSAIRLETTLSFARPVKQARWNPVKPKKLAVCTYDSDAVADQAGSGVFFWDGDWAEVDGGESLRRSEGIKIPAGAAEAASLPLPTFGTIDVRWAPDAEALVLVDKAQFCVCYEVAGETQPESLDELSIAHLS